MTRDWDDRERWGEELYEELSKKVELLDMYVPLAKEYARFNNIEIPSDDDDEYLNVIYGFVWDPKFIDYAFDKSGKIFNEQMYTLPITEKDIEGLKKSGIILSDEELKKINQNRTDE
jgi:hypothetical protein